MADAPRLAVDRRRQALVDIYTRAEAELTAAVAESLASGNLGTARYRQNQLRKIRAILEAAGAEGVEVATRLVGTGYVQGVQLVDTLAGRPSFAGAFSGVHQEAVDIIADNIAGQLGEAARTIGRRTEDVFRREGLAQVAQGLAQGATRREVSDALVEALTRQGMTAFTARNGARWGLSTYAEMVARTSTREAVSLGTANRLIENGQDLVTISSHAHEPDVCTPYDGKTFSLTGTTPGHPKLDRLPPFHPNAVIAGTLVEPVGEVRGGVRARWRGPLVDLTSASGIRLAIGPNHPVLTARGWLPAKLLREGDKVIRRARRQGPAARCSGEYLHDIPAPVEQIFDSLAAHGSRSRIPASPAHLHGDGRYCEGDVDVVRADGFLRRELVPSLAEHRGEDVLALAGAETAALTRQRPPRLGGIGVGRAVGGALADREAALAETAGQRPLREWPTLSEVLGRLAGEVTVDELVEVGYVDEWRGQAFDLETGDACYFADGLFVHNCVHVVAPADIDIDAAIAHLESVGSWEQAEQALQVGPVQGVAPPLAADL